MSTIRQLPLFLPQPIVRRNNKKNQRPGTRILQMTVLVLDNPELLAKAVVASGFNAAALAAEERRPHRMRFHFGFNKHALDSSDKAIILQHAVYLRQHPPFHNTRRSGRQSPGRDRVSDQRYGKSTLDKESSPEPEWVAPGGMTGVISRRLARHSITAESQRPESPAKSAQCQSIGPYVPHHGH